LTPLFATWLVERTGEEIAPAFLIMAAAAVTFVTVLWLREPIAAHSSAGVRARPRSPRGAELRSSASRVNCA